MAKINPELLNAIIKKTGQSRPQIYARIKQTASREYLPRHLAAIRLGADVGVNINKYAKSDELSQLRSAGAPVSPPPTTPATPIGPSPDRRAKGKKVAGRKPNKTPNQVFVVHGRDLASKDAVFAFLRAVGVKPIEWSSALAMTKKGSPYLGEILEAAFSQARAIVVLLTPDDLAQLREDLQTRSDLPYEKTLTGQARPNVLFEAGMAFATHPDRTVIVQLGTVREFSDVAGRHVVHMSNSFAKRNEFAAKLRNAGCEVDTSGTDWVSDGDFLDPLSRAPALASKKKRSRRR